VEFGALVVGGSRDDRGGPGRLAGRRPPRLPEPGQGHQRPIRERYRVGLFFLRPELLPLIEIVHRHNAAATLERVPEYWLDPNGLRHRVDRGEADLDVLAQYGTSPHRIRSRVRDPAFSS